MKKIGVVSLGCSKNRVDTENLLGYLKGYGFSFTREPSEAQVIIVNTCGFIESAKQESINTILEMAGYKKSGVCEKLIVTGCLSQRYMDELKEGMPEVDLFHGVSNYQKLAKSIAALYGAKPCGDMDRILTTPYYSAYLRIADGCSNRCTYCAIPLIRGDMKSVPMDELLVEANRLCDTGVNELTVIAQDTSAYGTDIYGKPMLAELLKRLAKIDDFRFIRLLYTYPNTVDEELIDTMLSYDNIANYIDIPIQHIDSTMLSAMNRHGSREHIEDIFNYIRKSSDDFILRSTVIVGFPGETKAQFDELMSYLRDNPIDRLGAFTYSAEEGTIAAELTGQIPKEEKARRLDELMRQQAKISLEMNKKRVGKRYSVLVDEARDGLLAGRSYAEAPEVDGSILIPCEKGKSLPRPGTFVSTVIKEAQEYDMIGDGYEFAE